MHACMHAHGFCHEVDFPSLELRDYSVHADLLAIDILIHVYVQCHVLLPLIRIVHILSLQV